MDLTKFGTNKTRVILVTNKLVNELVAYPSISFNVNLYQIVDIKIFIKSKSNIPLNFPFVSTIENYGVYVQPQSEVGMDS